MNFVGKDDRAERMEIVELRKILVEGLIETRKSPVEFVSG